MNAQWWIDFINENSEDKNFKEIIELANKIDEYGNNTNEEESLSNLSQMINEVKKKGYDKEDIDILKKKLKILENRRERRISENFGHFIKSRRKELGITLAELSEKTRISPSYINRIELAQRSSPSIVMVEKIAKGLAVPFVDVAEKSGIDLGLKSISGSISISHLVKNNNVSLRNMGPEMTEDEKKALMNIIDYISNATWGEDTREEAISVMNLIDNFKKVQQ